MGSQVYINVTGNLGKDARLQYQPDGSPFLSFSVAGRVGYGDREQAVWVSCTLWGKRAEGELAKYLKKGQLVSVNGFVSKPVNQDNPWLNVNVQDLTLLGSKVEAEAEAEAEAENKAETDIPF